MKNVTKEEFYASVMDLDVIITIEGNFPYTACYKFRDGIVKGKHLETFNSDQTETTHTYLIYN